MIKQMESEIEAAYNIWRTEVHKVKVRLLRNKDQLNHGEFLEEVN